MDLSEIPHDQWDYSVRQLALLNSSEDREYNSIYVNEILEVDQLLPQPLQTTTEDGIKYTFLEGSNTVCSSLAVERFSGTDCYLEWNTHAGKIPLAPMCLIIEQRITLTVIDSVKAWLSYHAGYDVDVTSERSVSNYLDNGAMCQLEHEQESIMQLTLENYPEFSDSIVLQEFGTPGTTSNCALDNIPWGLSPMEGSFGNDIFRMTTVDPDHDSISVSQFLDSPQVVLYPESLNEWLMNFTTAGAGTSPELPGFVCGQKDTSLCVPPSHEYPGDAHLALMDNHYAGEIEPEMLCTKEEEGSMQCSRKNKRKHQSGAGEERYCVQRRKFKASQIGEGTKVVQGGNRSSHIESGEESKIVQKRRKRVFQFVIGEERESVRSERARRAPRRYIDEWCKPKEKGKNKARKAVMAASKGLDFGASSSLPVSSTVHQFEDATKTASFMSIVPSQGNLL